MTNVVSFCVSFRDPAGRLIYFYLFLASDVFFLCHVFGTTYAGKQRNDAAVSTNGSSILTIVNGLVRQPNIQNCCT